MDEYIGFRFPNGYEIIDCKFVSGTRLVIQCFNSKAAQHFVVSKWDPGANQWDSGTYNKNKYDSDKKYNSYNRE